jgi:NAD(P)H-hydrate epimerase
MLQPQSIHEVPPPPPRPTDAHKGTFGTVIVVGGCETMIGAPALCATAALRSGAGLVKIATRAGVLPFALTIEPSATGIIIGDDLNTTLHQLDKTDPRHEAVLAVGPGLGQSAEAGELVEALLQGTRAVVLDADGLNLLSLTPLLLRQSQAEGRIFKTLPRRTAESTPLILTPHPGEFSRLAMPLGITHSPTDPATRPLAAAALADAYACTVILKGAHTIVTDGSRVYTNATGNPALATAGSGDVLTGLIAALVAQHMPPFDAAVLGVFLHGIAADMWATVHGSSGLTARDLATILPDAFNNHRTD